MVDKRKGNAMSKDFSIDTISSAGAEHMGMHDGADGFWVERGHVEDVLAAIEFTPKATLVLREFKPFGGDNVAGQTYAQGFAGRWFSCYVWVEIEDN